MAACTCGSDSRVTRGDSDLCPACLLRLALEPSVAGDEATRILGPVGRGPRGSVFMGVRPEGDSRIVTVKLLEDVANRQAFCDRVTETSRALDILMHPAIPELVEVGVTAAGQPYVMAPYVAGLSLREFLRSHLTDPIGRANVARQLCSVVAALHQHGIVHGSLKPTNIVITESEDGPWLFVLDTGIAEAVAFAASGAGAVTVAMDEQDLRGVVAEILGKSADALAGTGSAAQLVAMFERPVA